MADLGNMALSSVEAYHCLPPAAHRPRTRLVAKMNERELEHLLENMKAVTEVPLQKNSPKDLHARH